MPVSNANWEILKVKITCKSKFNSNLPLFKVLGAGGGGRLRFSSRNISCSSSLSAESIDDMEERSSSSRSDKFNDMPSSILLKDAATAEVADGWFLSSLAVALVWLDIEISDDDDGIYFKNIERPERKGKTNKIEKL